MTDPITSRTWGYANRRRIPTRDFPAGVLALVDERQGGRFCEACGPGVTLPPGQQLEIDHRHPLSKGGDNHYLNLRWLCTSHNRGRGNRRGNLRRPRWARGPHARTEL